MNKSFRDPAKTETVTVEDIGGRGDGIAYGAGGKYYVPQAALGDRVEIMPGKARDGGRAARIVRVVSAGPDRVEPACPHFGTCGGCALQHIDAVAIAPLKREFVVRALARRALDPREVAPTVSVDPGTRRRVRFALRRGRAVTFGFRAPRSHSVVEIKECPAILPAAAQLIPALKSLAISVSGLGKNAEIQVTASETGFDVLMRPLTAVEPTLHDRTLMAEFAANYDIARIAWDDGFGIEPVAMRRQPRVMFDGVALDLPLDAFLQPSRGGEAAIVEAVLHTADGATRIADLYAGCGALTFPLSSKAPVSAYEGGRDMVHAVRRAAAGRPVTAEVRDLAREPLRGRELSSFDTIVFDPPRAGAAAQAAAIAKTAAATVVAVSCNPATLARDLRILVDGGYRLESVQPIDQFPWSHHVEAVAVLRR